jgi:TetR/AcrR family tetracycline transcriptional repressor
MGRPKTPLIHRAEVAAQALKIIDADGVEALNIRRLAKDLGVSGAALYYHYADKTGIFDDVARLVLNRIELPDLVPGRDWLAYHVELVVAYYEALSAHPRAAPLMLNAQPRSTRTKMSETLLTYYREAGLDREAGEWVMKNIEAYVIGLVLLGAAGGTARLDRERDTRRVRVLVRRFLEVLLAENAAMPDGDQAGRQRTR